MSVIWVRENDHSPSKAIKLEKVDVKSELTTSYQMVARTGAPHLVEGYRPSTCRKLQPDAPGATQLPPKRSVHARQLWFRKAT
jgi:hypothetical protein